MYVKNSASLYIKMFYRFFFQNYYVYSCKYFSIRIFRKFIIIIKCVYKYILILHKNDEKNIPCVVKIDL